jgi:cell division protease FtsH
MGEDVDFTKIARRTAGLTGAELANICNEAAISAARNGRTALAQFDFDYALERVVAGMETPRTLNERERTIVAYHEAGHALCAELLPGATPTHRISIVPRGKALGYTLHFPEEDRYLDTQEELMDQLAVSLGGRAAEQVVFGSITNGAADDLRKVADKTRRMIHEWAMGTSVSALQLNAESCATPSSSIWPTTRCAGPSGSSPITGCSWTCWRRSCCRPKCSSARTSSASWPV